MAKTKKQKLVTVEPHLVYYKTGDDFAAHLEHQNNDVGAAYKAWAAQIASAADYLQKMAEALKEQEGVSGGGGANSIHLTVPEALAETLIKADLVRKAPWPDEEDDDGSD